MTSFPLDFLWGVATASYQIEGAAFKDDKGLSIWDVFSHMPGHIVDQSTGDVACDSYHMINEDIRKLKELGVSCYRFSLSWCRILPDGIGQVPNFKGIDYYNRLIDELLAVDIQPMVTLYHWDLPLSLHYLGGWSNPNCVNWFENYARTCFEHFGNRVKFWVTFNEPLEFISEGYAGTSAAPGLNDRLFLAVRAAHNVIRCHSKVYRLYVREFKSKQHGVIGITLDSRWIEPKDPQSVEDQAASERYLQCIYGLFSNPIHGNGDYPEVLKKRMSHICSTLGLPSSSLPDFTEEEILQNKGSSDFFGLNHYTTRLCTTLRGSAPVDFNEWLTDTKIEIDPSWKKAASEWLFVVPWGLRKLLNWIKVTYDNPVVYITENGFSDGGQLDDTERIDYHKKYIAEAQKATVVDGCNLKGYFAWSLMDNFEWNDGYTKKFGLYHVDFNDSNRTRSAKSSAKFFSEIIKNNGVN